MYKPITIRTHRCHMEISTDVDTHRAMIAAELDDKHIEYTIQDSRATFIVDRSDAYDAIHRLSFLFDIEVV